MPVSGILRQLVAKVTIGKSKGNSTKSELDKELSQENIAKATDGECCPK